MRPRTRKLALGALATVHGLCILGAPFGMALHLGQGSRHQDFHVVWEGLKHATASGLALAIVLGPLARGERWAFWALSFATLLLFGGVFVSDVLTRGAATFDRVAFGTLLVVSVAALAALDRGTEQAATPKA